MEPSSSSRRFQVIHSHFIQPLPSPPPPPPQGEVGLSLEPTAGEFYIKNGYSVELPEKLSTGKWNVYRSAHSPLRLIDHFPDRPEDRTLHDNFMFSLEKFGDLNYLGTRVRDDGSVGEYKWITYAEAGKARAAIGSGLILHGISKGSCVGIYMINRAEWVVTDLACLSYSFISVPLYDTLGPDAVKFIMDQSEMACVFCTLDKLQSVLNSISEQSTVRLIVVVGGNQALLHLLPSKPGVDIVSFSKLQEQGQSNLKSFVPPLAEDIATICYTSGTTGIPKGAVLSHGNIFSNIAAASVRLRIYSTDVYISYLPLAHIYERAALVLMSTHGAAIGFYQGDAMKLFNDVEILRPTIFASVPRIYNRIYDGVISAVRSSGGISERLFNIAYNAKKHALQTGKIPSPIWDLLVFNKIKARLGGRVRFMTSGASPLSAEVLDFLRICFGGYVAEGYGMTETACFITSNDEDDNTSGHVGSPIPGSEIKLVDVPEMNYTAEDMPHPRGEICVRGPVIFKGYYKAEAQTREVVDEEGWLHTGDIGEWLPGGRLKIIDRKKNIFKLAQGEYIAPEKIENVYSRSKFIAQCFVHGDSLNSSLVAIIVVDPEELSKWAKTRGIKHANDVEALCKDPEVRATVLADMDALGHAAQLRGFEFVKSIALIAEPFTVENGMLTPTFKVKRPQARARFAKAIDDMYAELASRETLGRSML